MPSARHASLVCAAAAFAAARPLSDPISISVDTTIVTNPSVNKRFMGCHHDYGFAQAPRGYYANLIYGSMFEKGTCSVDSWSTRLAAGADGATASAPYAAFSSKPSTSITLNSGAQVAMVNRGICYAGLSLVGGQPYTVSVWLWAGDAVTAFVELRDFTTNTSLARQDFAVQSTGPDWGSTWFQYNFTLTPSVSTTCTGIPFGSDPSIDCGGDAGPAHVCVRCGGEFLIGVSSPGNIKVGYVTLMPGPWGLLQGPSGPLPVLKSGADGLTQLGVTVMRAGGSVSQSMRWKDWRGPAWNRASQQQLWGSSLLSGWGPFEIIDMCNALGIEPIITLAYDTNDATDWADLVEYAWGDESTAWGQRRAADGHPAVYNITIFELGNEQYNPFFVDQVVAMEARAAKVGAPPLRYMFPSNGGLTAADAQRVLNLGIDVTRIMPDLHVGAGGAVGSAAGLFDNPPVPGFNQSAINCETNAGTHDHTRAMNEAADLIDFFTASTAVTNRIYARTASFCSGTSAQFDSWDQGILFFLPNMTWLQPPGWVHVMFTQTWAERTVQATYTSLKPPTYSPESVPGFLADGDDVFVGNLTLAQAEAMCTNITTCLGFTFEGTDPAPTTPVLVYLKSAVNFSPASGWYTYTSSRAADIIPFAAQTSADGGTLTLRAVNQGNTTQPLNVLLASGTHITGSGTMWTLSSPDPAADNTPSNPMHVAPVQATAPAGTTSISTILPAYSVVVLQYPISGTLK